MTPREVAETLGAVLYPGGTLIAHPIRVKPEGFVIAVRGGRWDSCGIASGNTEDEAWQDAVWNLRASCQRGIAECVPAVERHATLTAVLARVDAPKPEALHVSTPTPDGRHLSRAVHDARGGLSALSDAADILARVLAGPPERIHPVVDLCDRDGWLQARRRAMRERLDALDAEMDRALAVARARIHDTGVDPVKGGA